MYKKIQDCKNPTYEDMFFGHDALDMFLNNRYVNSIFVYKIENNEYILFSECDNTEFDANNKSIKLIDSSEKGIFVSTSICTDEEYDSKLDRFFLIVDEYKPLGSEIKYFLLFNDKRKFPIKPNGNMPLKIEGNKPSSFKIVAELHSNGVSSPEIKAIAVSYHDNVVENQLGLINPNLRPNDNNQEEKVFLEYESLLELFNN